MQYGYSVITKADFPMEDVTRTLVRSLYAVDTGDEVVLQTDAGTRIVGCPSRVDRDEAGIRLEVCPFDGNAPQYRVRAQRTPTGWRAPVVERRPMHGDWQGCGTLVDLQG